MILLRIISPGNAWHAITNGTDVYLFLTGMMTVSELARRKGVFRWLAGQALRASKRSPSRLFAMVYGVGTVVTVFLSNDATAVVLTPAVLAAVKSADAEPMPYLLICAFVANAASFVLPISNPANLVVFGEDMPSLQEWLATFCLPSIAAILATFSVLRWVLKARLQGILRSETAIEPLSPAGKLTLSGVAFLAVTLMTASALHAQLGGPAFLAGLLLLIAVSWRDVRASRDVLTQIPWSVLPLVAGLFVIVEALNHAGASAMASTAFRHLESWPRLPSALVSAFGVAFLSNLINNLPGGLLAGSALHAAKAAKFLRSAVLIGVDLGPNLSVTGSLATILWLMAIRREGIAIGFRTFVKYGALVMPLALFLSIMLLLAGG